MTAIAFSQGKIPPCAGCSRGTVAPRGWRLTTPGIQQDDEGRLDRRRDDQERKNDGEVPPQGVLHLPPDRKTLLSAQSPKDRHSQPQAVGSGDKKRRELEDSVGEHRPRRVPVSRDACRISVQRTQEKPVESHGEDGKDSHDQPQKEHQEPRDQIVHEDLIEEGPAGEIPEGIDERLECLRRHLPSHGRGEEPREESDGKERGQGQKVRFQRPLWHRLEIQNLLESFSGGPGCGDPPSSYRLPSIFGPTIMCASAPEQRGCPAQFALQPFRLPHSFLCGVAPMGGRRGHSQ